MIVTPTESEKARARELAKSRACPHCGAPISITDAISFVQGDGHERNVMLQTDDDSVLAIRLVDVNPQEVKIRD